MNRIKKTIGYAILACLVTVGSLDAQTCREPVNPVVPLASTIATTLGAFAFGLADEPSQHTGPMVVLSAASVFGAARTWGAGLDQAAYDNCLAWEAYHLAQAQDSARAAEIRERADQLIREGVARRAAHRAYIARLQAYLDTAKR